MYKYIIEFVKRSVDEYYTKYNSNVRNNNMVNTTESTNYGINDKWDSQLIPHVFNTVCMYIHLFDCFAEINYLSRSLTE